MSNEVTVQEMGCLARAFAKSNFFGFKNEAEAFTLMAIAQANGLHPAKAAERYHIIQGRPAMKADAMLSAFQESGGKVKWLKRTDTECKLWLSHPQGGELEVTWTIERANKAGVTGKQTWKQYPTQMLSARCVSEGVRALYPACLSGMYTPEEVSDFSNGTPKAETAAPEKAEAEVVQTELGTPQEDYNTMTAPLFAEESEEDNRKKANFVKAMAALKAKDESLYTDTLGVMGYSSAAEVPAEQRKSVFKELQKVFDNTIEKENA